MAGDIARGSLPVPFLKETMGNQAASKAGSDKTVLKEGAEIIPAYAPYRHIISILKGAFQALNIAKGKISGRKQFHYMIVILET